MIVDFYPSIYAPATRCALRTRHAIARASMLPSDNSRLRGCATVRGRTQSTRWCRTAAILASFRIWLCQFVPKGGLREPLGADKGAPLEHLVFSIPEGFRPVILPENFRVSAEHETYLCSADL